MYVEFLLKMHINDFPASLKLRAPENCGLIYIYSIPLNTACHKVIVSLLCVGGECVQWLPKVGVL